MDMPSRCERQNLFNPRAVDSSRKDQADTKRPTLDLRTRKLHKGAEMNPILRWRKCDGPATTDHPFEAAVEIQDLTIGAGQVIFDAEIAAGMPLVRVRERPPAPRA